MIKVYTMRMALLMVVTFCMAAFNKAFAVEELSSGEAVFSYSTSESYATYGSNSTGTHDFAIYLPGDDFSGKTINRIRVVIIDTSVTNLKVWLSSDLKTTLSNGETVNNPDIVTMDAEVAEGTVEVTLESPYTVTSDGVYVGYSFDVNNANSYPFPINTSVSNSNGCFIRTNGLRSGAWGDYSSMGCLPIAVVMTGYSENTASLSIEKSTAYAAVNQAGKLHVNITNYGSSSINSVEISYVVEGSTISETLDLSSEPLTAIIGTSASLDLPLPALSTTGSREVTDIKLSKVNGVENTYDTNTFTINYNILNWLPTHRSVAEEYTGLWCGYCPRGYVAMEAMHRLHPDEFIGIAYHNRDSMQVTTNYPSSIAGFPAASVNRGEVIDPSYISTYWAAGNEEVAPANIEATASLSEDETTVTVNAKTVFPTTLSDIDYSVEFILQIDSLYGSTWAQANYYYDTDPSAAEGLDEEYALFFGTSNYVYGLKYNDVFLNSSRLSNENASVPTSVTADDEQTYTYTFNLGDVSSSLLQDVKNLKVAVLLIDNETGAVANACQAKVVSATTGIKNISAAENNTGEVEYYDMSGRKLNAPVKGINIMKTADGKTVKIFK